MTIDLSRPEEWPYCLTVAETAEVTRLSEGMVYELVRRGDLPARRVGRRVLIPRAGLLAWLAPDERKNPLRLVGGRG